MFGIGMSELLIILVIALIVFGPSKLPDLAKSLGKGLAEFKKVKDDFEGSLKNDFNVEEEENHSKSELSSVDPAQDHTAKSEEPNPINSEETEPKASRPDPEKWEGNIDGVEEKPQSNYTDMTQEIKRQDGHAG